MTPQVERDAHQTQTYWMEIRHIVKKIYRDKLSLTSKGSNVLTTALPHASHTHTHTHTLFRSDRQSQYWFRENEDDSEEAL